MKGYAHCGRVSFPPPPPSLSLSLSRSRLRYCLDTTDSSQICFADRYHRYIRMYAGRKMEREIEGGRRGRERGREAILRSSALRRAIIPSCIRCIKNVTSFNGPISRQPSLAHSSSGSSYSWITSTGGYHREESVFVARSTTRDIASSNDERVLPQAIANRSFPTLFRFVSRIDGTHVDHLENEHDRDLEFSVPTQFQID